MNDAHPAGVVVDTMVISWLFDDRPNPLADRYRALIGPVPVLLAFQTVMELRFGAIRAGWGELRLDQQDIVPGSREVGFPQDIVPCGGVCWPQEIVPAESVI
ncbi:MAG TPA: hypothetical protein VFA16_00815 [Mycobacterium sp.]|uniref:hypothetical protein n=1 Tax=Mycobacterium sp. TaxID=1785 RepID=UPI002D3CFA4A|nr:hypothetical protein [Mycobacterium sp.]HZU45789.1 hypothetical protein [Mycobacterium sp.]